MLKKQVKKCIFCNRALRDWNKSGICSNCGSGVARNKESMVLVKKRKLYEIKRLLDDLLREIEK